MGAGPGPAGRSDPLAEIYQFPALLKPGKPGFDLPACLLAEVGGLLQCCSIFFHIICLATAVAPPVGAGIHANCVYCMATSTYCVSAFSRTFIT